MGRVDRRTDADVLHAAFEDRDAFAVFYARFERPVAGFFMRATGSGELAVDLTAEVFAQALESAARGYEAISSYLTAAELWAQVATSRQSEGLRAKAAQANRKSAELSDRCEGARTHPLGWAVDPVPLSRREREIATLAAQGATNAQIAAELSVSVRTVETHLYHAFAKLGVAERSQLSDALA